MILPFSTQLNGKPTYFPEKILSGMLKEFEGKKNKDFSAAPEFIYEYGVYADYPYVEACLMFVDECIPKIHSIREDKKDRWKVGYLIDYFINSRTKDMFRFAPRVNCLNIQKIVFEWSGGEINTVTIYIDDVCYVANYEKDYNQSKQRQERMEVLAFNDGFDSVEDFLNYFNQDFTGKLIHWTDFKY
jgi:hypothetical protein